MPPGSFLKQCRHRVGNRPQIPVPLIIVLPFDVAQTETGMPSNTAKHVPLLPYCIGIYGIALAF